MTDKDATEFALEAVAYRGFGEFVLSGERPDEKVRDRPAIDFVARTADERLLAIEHTSSEPYEDFLADWRLFHERLGEVREQLVGRLPEDSVFDIVLPPAAASRVRSRDAEAITNWIAAAAPGLGLPPHHSATVPSKISSAPLTVRRWNREGPQGPQVRYRIGADPEALAQQSRARVRRSLEDKLPKLESAKTAHAGPLTLLCLESPDLQMTDAFGLLDTLRIACGDLPEPDFLILVMVGPDEQPFMSWTYREPAGWLDRPWMFSREVSPL
jgi:hypothetical protein